MSHDESQDERSGDSGRDPEADRNLHGVSLDAKAAAFRALEEIVERLRAPDGCPWDRAQTLTNMAPHILEEACEAIEAIEDGKGSASTALCEELGDLLMNILLAARISEESGGFSFRELAQGIAAKLVRRHPHVFGGEKVSSVEEVLTRWNAIKVGEKAERSTGPAPSRLGEQPRSLPALIAAFRVGEKAAGVGFDWPDAAGALRKVEEELREVSEALDGRVDAHLEANRADSEDSQARLRQEIGDLLFAAVNLARKTGIEPESALRAALDRFRSRFRYIEERVDFSRASLVEMEKLWEEAKRLAV